MTTLVMIPARYGSSRLPGKPLLDIGGQPMVIRVAQVARQAGFKQAVVATDDERIKQVVSAAGFPVVMTAREHASGTDRLQEAASQLNLAAEDIIVNLQGDEPLMPIANLHQVARLLQAHPDAEVATLYETITEADLLTNSNAVKLVQDDNQAVLYFSRAPIPWDRDGIHSLQDGHWKRHIGLYAYRKSALDAFVSWPQAPLEAIECLEQLRFLHHGRKIVAAKAEAAVPAGVDTAADLEAVREHFAQGDPS